MTAQDRPRHLKGHTMVLAVELELHKQPDHHGVLLQQHNINKIKHKKVPYHPGENMQHATRRMRSLSDTRALLLDAVDVHEDDAEDGGEEAEGERVRRENLSTEKWMPVALACCWMILVMMCASTPVREG